MSSTISHNTGDVVYVPFWIVLEYLDIEPPDPFVECIIIAIGERMSHSVDGPIKRTVCDLRLGKDNLIAYAVPANYLILLHDLNEWATKIGNWFKDYPNTLARK